MKKNYPLFTLLLGILLATTLFLSGCNDLEEPCTEVFYIIDVEVASLVPDEVYTVRETTGDTLRFEPLEEARYYPVVDDSLLDLIQNTEETFWFHAVVDGVVEIREAFVIAVDHCHVEKISGPSTL